MFLYRIILICSWTCCIFVHCSNKQHHKPVNVVRGDVVGGVGISVLPLSNQYTNVVVWLHGLGDTSESWASMVQSLNLDNTKFILPTAPRRPVNLNGGKNMTAWYDLYALEPGAKEDKDGLDNSAARITKVIQIEIDKGISPSKIIVGGFSQGAAMAFHVAFRSSHPLAACIALSGWLPLHHEYPDAFSPGFDKAMPILQAHGEMDLLVHYKWGRNVYLHLKKKFHLTGIEWFPMPGRGHGTSSEELQKVAEFIRELYELDELGDV